MKPQQRFALRALLFRSRAQQQLSPQRSHRDNRPTRWQSRAQPTVVQLILVLIGASWSQVSNAQQSQSTPSGSRQGTARTDAGVSDQKADPPPAVGVRLEDALAEVQRSLDVIDPVQSYSCLLVKRERLNGQLGPYQYLSMKIRREPLSVYLKFLRPEAIAGQEALYVQGQNSNQMLAHGVGWKALLGTRSFDPTDPTIMQGTRHPITEAGLHNMLLRFLRWNRPQPGRPPVEVRLHKNTRIESRKCLCVEVVWTRPMPGKPFAGGRLFLDEKTRVPLRYEGYEWPEDETAPLVLAEEYTYQQLSFQQKLTDQDFDHGNPAYNFAKPSLVGR